MSLKAVILVGGAAKGTRFRPLSLQSPKPLFPVAGVPLIEHHIDQLSSLKGLSHVYLLGFYEPDQFDEFVAACKDKYHIPVEYLKEDDSMGTAGGLLKFEAEILADNPKAVFVLNADVCGDLPVQDMVDELDRQTQAECLLLSTEATRQQSTNFGCVVIEAGKIVHYVEKPSTFISCHISCGVYLLRQGMWRILARTRQSQNGNPQLWFETDVFPQMASESTLCTLHTTRWWSQTKTPAATLYANRHYLRLYREQCPEKLCHNGAQIEGDVYIDPTARVHPTAKIGPNVSVSANAVIGAGVRVRESIILPECVLNEHCCVLHSIIGWKSTIGSWARVEGTPISPNPNIPFAKLDNRPLFNADGRLNPSLTIIGSDVNVSDHQIILNCVVLPYKDLSDSYKNQIIL